MLESLGWVGRKWQPAQVFLPGKSCGQRSLVGYSPWSCKELDTTELIYITFTSLPYLHIYCSMPPFLSNLCPYLRKISFFHNLTIRMLAQMVKNLPAMLETWVWFLGWEHPLAQQSTPTGGFLPGRLQSTGSQRVRLSTAPSIIRISVMIHLG